MRILTRYILVQLFSVFLVALCVVTVLMLTVGVMREMLEQHIGIVQVARMIPFILPDALRFALPATILFAACFTFGRMASSNEIVAIKAMGISPWKIFWPVAASVTLLSFATVWLNDLAVSWGRDGVRRVIIESVEDIAYGMLRTQRTYSAARFTINVKGVEGRRLVQPTFTFLPDQKRPSIVIRAEWAELSADLEKETLTIRMHKGSVVGVGVEAIFPDTIERVLPLNRASRKGVESRRPSQLALREIPDAELSQHGTIARIQQQMATDAAFQLVAGDFRAIADSDWRRAQNSLSKSQQQLFRLRTEPHRRWAAGFSCLCFVAVGAPLAIRRRYGEFWTSFFLCFMPILIVYYPLLMFSLDRAKLGVLPPQILWLGNAFLLVWSAWLMRKVIRY